ncbi:sensor histidine kinase [Paenalkalicoccus suaedae]|uniref:Sensor histidine kinase n=1 Tax=Paenalkalicoccus suaedae TaxID=2592382 RepID=A0A859FI40_9BACI|nr:sensor histidine kinase [Paenalkalicoccus suaedae]QKS71866.1 sensor histidine kinase [Paenalkalicoccus suaedae]
MNRLTIQLYVTSISLAVLMITLGLLTYMTFPIELGLLWSQTLFSLPYIVTISLILLGAAFFFGLITVYFWRKQAGAVNKSLDTILDGRELEENMEQAGPDLRPIFEKLTTLQERVNYQRELSQRLATQQAEEREESLQQVVAEERNRLARELHDSVSQQLFAASMLIATANETQERSEQLELVEKMVNQAQTEMRALLLHLRPAQLKGKRLDEGIQGLIQELEQRVPVRIIAKLENLSLAKGTEDHLFRIVQEAMSNTLRHAQATQMELLLMYRENTVILRVTDNGKGFVPEETVASYGLQTMKERAEEVGGTLKVVSVLNQGTKLEVKIPMVKEAT